MTIQEVVNEVVRCGSKGFVTANSCGEESRYEVVAKFQNLKDMQDFYSALAKLRPVSRIASTSINDQ